MLYATTPVKGLIGQGMVTRKFVDREPFWSTEFRRGIALWTLRLSFSISLLIPEEQWEQKAITVSPHQSARQRAMQRINDEVAKNFIKSLEKLIASRA